MPASISSGTMQQRPVVPIMVTSRSPLAMEQALQFSIFRKIQKTSSYREILGDNIFLAIDFETFFHHLIEC